MFGDISTYQNRIYCLGSSDAKYAVLSDHHYPPTTITIITITMIIIMIIIIIIIVVVIIVVVVVVVVVIIIIIIIVIIVIINIRTFNNCLYDQLTFAEAVSMYQGQEQTVRCLIQWDDSHRADLSSRRCVLFLGVCSVTRCHF